MYMEFIQQPDCCVTFTYKTNNYLQRTVTDCLIVINDLSCILLCLLTNCSFWQTYMRGLETSSVVVVYGVVHI